MGDTCDTPPVSCLCFYQTLKWFTAVTYLLCFSPCCDFSKENLSGLPGMLCSLQSHATCCSGWHSLYFVSFLTLCFCVCLRLYLFHQGLMSYLLDMWFIIKVTLLEGVRLFLLEWAPVSQLVVTLSVILLSLWVWGMVHFLGLLFPVQIDLICFPGFLFYLNERLWVHGILAIC